PSLRRAKPPAKIGASEGVRRRIVIRLPSGRAASCRSVVEGIHIYYAIRPGCLRASRDAAYRLPRPEMTSLIDRSWPVLRRLMGGHTAIYRLSGGLIGHRFPGTPPMLLLDHVGAKSGTKRTIPLVYVDDPPNL